MHLNKINTFNCNSPTRNFPSIRTRFSQGHRQRSPNGIKTFLRHVFEVKLFFDLTPCLKNMARDTTKQQNVLDVCLHVYVVKQLKSWRWNAVSLAVGKTQILSSKAKLLCLYNDLLGSIIYCQSLKQYKPKQGG